MKDRHASVVFVTVGLYWTPWRAWILRNKLVDEGVTAFVHDECVVSMYWLYANALRGIKVQVPVEQMDQAQRIIARDDSHVFSSQPHCDGDSNRPACAQCGSTEIYEELVNLRLFIAVWVVFGIPFPFLSSATECYGCGRREGPPKSLPYQYRLWHLFAFTTAIACVLWYSLTFGYSWLDLVARGRLPTWLVR